MPDDRPNSNGVQEKSIFDGDPRRRRAFSRAREQGGDLPTQGQLPVDIPGFTMRDINYLGQTTKPMDQDCSHNLKKIINALT